MIEIPSVRLVPGLIIHKRDIEVRSGVVPGPAGVSGHQTGRCGLEGSGEAIGLPLEGYLNSG